MADKLVSVTEGQTSPYGLAEELVQDLWDTAVGLALREIPTARQFIDKRPVNPMAHGSSITLEKFEWLTPAQVTAAKTPLSEESDVEAIAPPKPTPVTLTPNEYGTVLVQTRKFKNRTFAPVDEFAAMALAQHAAEVVDSLVQDVMVASTNVTYAGTGNAAVNDLEATDKLTAAAVRREVTRLRAAKVLPWFGNFYAALIHPHTEHDLREETGAGSWRTPNEYGVSQERIWNGEVGEFEGCRFVVNALVRNQTNSSSVQAYQNYFIGRTALAEHVIEDIHAVVSPQVDRLNRFYGVGWYGDLGFARYEEKALRRVVSSSALEGDLSV